MSHASRGDDKQQNQYMEAYPKALEGRFLLDILIFSFIVKLRDTYQATFVIGPLPRPTIQARMSGVMMQQWQQKHNT